MRYGKMMMREGGARHHSHKHMKAACYFPEDHMCLPGAKPTHG